MLNEIAAYEIIECEVYRIHWGSGLTPEERRSFPGLIAANDKGGIRTNLKIEKSISYIAGHIRNKWPDVKKKYEIKEWSKIVRRTFGPVLADHEYNSGKNASILKHNVERDLKIILATGYDGIERSIGCKLFSNTIQRPIDYGVVRLESRDDWLFRQKENNCIDDLSYSKIKHAVDTNIDSFSSDSFLEIRNKTISEQISDWPMMCAVITNGLSDSLAKTRTIVCAKLALTSISLAYQYPSKIFESFQLSCDAPPRKLCLIPTKPNANYLAGFETIGAMPGTTYMAEADLEAFFETHTDFEKFYGSLFRCWAECDYYESASEEVKSVSQSIYWIYEAMKEDNRLMSIVKYTASLESLAAKKGGREIAVTNLISESLGINPEKVIYKNENLISVVKRLYTVARSRTLHGSNHEYLQDWSDYRSIAEQLVREVFLRRAITLSNENLY